MHLKSAIPNIYNMHRKKELRTNAHIMTPSFLHHVKERREETQKGRRENRGGVKHHAIKYVYIYREYFPQGPSLRTIPYGLVLLSGKTVWVF